MNKFDIDACDRGKSRYKVKDSGRIVTYLPFSYPRKVNQRSI